MTYGIPSPIQAEQTGRGHDTFDDSGGAGRGGVVSSLLVRSVRPAGGALTDVLVDGGRIAALGPASAPRDVEVIDGAGALLLPGLVDAHCHVDKTLWGRPWVPHSAGPTLASKIGNERRRRDEFGLPSADNATALIATMVAAGTSYIRTHTDVDPDRGLAGIDAVNEAAERHRHRVTVEQVAFPQAGLLTRPGTLELLEKAAAAGVANIGGIDPAGYDRDPCAHLDAIFDIAARHGCGIDIHLHDEGTLGAWQFELIIERTKRYGLPGRVTISHAFGICGLDPDWQQRLIDGLAEQDISLATAAVFDAPVPPLRELHAAGANLACGHDGIRDLWSPYGTGDMLDRAMQVAYRSEFRTDPDIELALHAATHGGAHALRVPEYGLQPGCHADFFLVDAPTPAAAVVTHPPRSLVVKRGRVVARDGKLT